jgi:hypothetical protein
VEMIAIVEPVKELGEVLISEEVDEEDGTDVGDWVVVGLDVDD